MDVIRHYDKLIEENNDPVHDPEPLKKYMDKWDGAGFIERLELDKSKNVLEVGVGTGRLAIRTVPYCRRFTGIDISPKTVERARKNLSQYSNVELHCGDFLTYDFSDSFDVIYCSLTFMHIQDKRAAIVKISSLLNDGGIFVLSIDKSQDKYIDMGTRKIRIYPDTPVNIKRDLKFAGLALTEEFKTDNAYIFSCKKQPR